MIKLLLPLFLFVSFITMAQKQESKPEFPNENNSFITFDISTATNFVAPRYRFGYIHSLNEKWRVGADIGFGSERSTLRLLEDFDNDDYRLYEGRFEVYNILNPTRRVNMYVSGEVYYIHHTEVYYRDHYDSESLKIGIRYDKADMTREKYGFNLKYGVMAPFGDIVGMNAYIGAGPRLRDVKFSNVVNPVPTNEGDYEDTWGANNYQKEGSKLGFNFSLGIKFFYQFQ
jgi:hypothetical protein